MDFLTDEQLSREALMAQRGRDRARSNLEKALERGEAADTVAGLRLMKQALAPMSDAIAAFVAEAQAGGAGRRHTAVKFLKDVDPDLAAYLTVRATLTSAVRQYSLKTAANGVGERLEMELLADRFETANGALFRAVVRNAEARGMSPARQAKAVELANRHFQVTEKPWTQGERLIVGTKLVELMAEKLNIVEVVYLREGKRTIHRVQFTPEIGEWFAKYNHASTLTRPLYLPTVAPPNRWEGVRGNPYHSPIVRRNNTILTRAFPGQIDAIDAAGMPAVYKAVNGLQETSWRINKRVLEVMKQAWETGLVLPCLPSHDDTPLPEAPEEVVNDVKGGAYRRAWRRKMRAIHEANASSRSIRFEFSRALAVAEENKDQAALYFPHHLDFRGRAYAASTSLSPQGPDEVKGLLEFAHGKPLGSRGLFWLGVHGANLFGNDKVSLEERYRWAMEEGRAIAGSVGRPDGALADLRWTEADKPWCFLAWCFEWYAAVRLGADFTSHLPIALDGSCNGIQHFSAMLRDEVGGAAVNLVPSDKPSDIYAEVAKVAQRKLEAKAEEEGENQWKYQGWVQFGIDRKTTKRAVMVLPYGGTYKSCQDYVGEAVRERIAAGQVNPFGDELYPAIGLLAGVIWESIGEVVIAAREVMGWLQKLARTASKAGKSLAWTTPSGFIVHQSYRQKKGKRIQTVFNGSAIFFRTDEDTDKLDGQKQASSVSPNFVHSLDASAMMLTIGACLDKGIRSFAMIHDSYGTHAADTDELAHTLRAEFVRMYQENDVLGAFRQSVAETLTPEEAAKLPPVPAHRGLDLNAVLQSPYFFA